MNTLGLAKQLAKIYSISITEIIAHMTRTMINNILYIILKVLCDIRAGCLLIEATHAHAVNKQWVWHWMADKFVSVTLSLMLTMALVYCTSGNFVYKETFV